MFYKVVILYDVICMETYEKERREKINMMVHQKCQNQSTKTNETVQICTQFAKTYNSYELPQKCIDQFQLMKYSFVMDDGEY